MDEEPTPHKISLIALSSDMVTERDFSLMLPSGGEVAYYTSRMPLTLPVTVENLRLMSSKLAEAASLILPTYKLDVIAYSCTSASVAIGPSEIAAQIQSERPEVDVGAALWFGEGAWTTLQIGVDAAVAALQSGDHF